VVKLGILGPLSVVDDAGAQRPVPAARQRIMLAALLAQANRAVAAAELAELIWNGAPPPGAAKTMRVYMARLRQAVGPAVAGRIVTRDPGYLCEVSEDEADLLLFEQLRWSGPGLGSRPLSCWPGRWGCGGAGRWPMPPRRPCARRASRAWNSCACRRSKAGSKPT
jgi:hypothetical protein